MMRYCLVIIAASGLIACGIEISIGDGDKGNGSVTTTFQMGGDMWQIQANRGQGQSLNLLFGQFSADNTAYPDLVLLAKTGAYYYKNNLPANSGWDTRIGHIDSTVGKTYTAALAMNVDLDSNNTDDLILYSDSIGRIEILLNQGNDNFTLGPLKAFTVNVSWMCAAPFRDRSASKNNFHLLAVSGSQGPHRLFRVVNGNFDANEGKNIGDNITSAVKCFSADINSDGYYDFVIIPSASNLRPVFFVNDKDEVFNMVNANIVRPGSAGSVSEAVIGDFDADGAVDLLLATSKGFELYLNQSKEDEIAFQYQANAHFNPNSTDVIWMEYGDLTEDSNFDLIVARKGKAPILYSNLGDLNFTDITTNAFGTQLDSAFGANSAGSITQVHIHDINKDRVNDVIVVNANGDIAVYFNQAKDSNDAD